MTKLERANFLRFYAEEIERINEAAENVHK